MKSAFFLLTALLAASDTDCEARPSSDEVQQRQQERILGEGTAAVGMPAIKFFREKRLLKLILELRDQDNLSTYTYLWSEVLGRAVFACNSIGYGIPYATQYTNPQYMARDTQRGFATLPQADPNGLFSPASADGTWVMCKDPNGGKTEPVFFEPRVIVSPFELPTLTGTPTEPKNSLPKK